MTHIIRIIINLFSLKLWALQSTVDGTSVAGEARWWKNIARGQNGIRLLLFLIWSQFHENHSIMIEVNIATSLLFTSLAMFWCQINRSF